MGYRNYIATFPKREYNKIKSLTQDELIKFYSLEVDDEGFWYKGVYEYGKPLYEFGKYVDFEPPKTSIKRFFKNKNLNDKYNDETEFFIVTKEFLEYVIDLYKKRIINYYDKMLHPFSGEKEDVSFLKTIKKHYNYPDNSYTFDFNSITKEEQTALYEIINHVKSMKFEWEHFDNFDLKNGDEVTTSWKYEYSIFELIRIYKTFDWKKNVMIYYGY